MYTVRKDKGLFMSFEVFVWNDTLEALIEKVKAEGLSSADQLNVSHMGTAIATIWFSTWSEQVEVARHNSQDTIVPVEEEDEVTEENDWEEYDLLAEDEVKSMTYPAYLPVCGDDWEDFTILTVHQQVKMKGWEDAPAFE